MAPNFFLEAKIPDGSLAVATRQACYDGALGADSSWWYTQAIRYHVSESGDQSQPRGFVTLLNAWGMTRNFGDLSTRSIGMPKCLRLRKGTEA
ncbi:hypothetical protein PAAG_02475 [Paracoccidioides lutzii Pb01]|uniref:Uncharacterized protein n=1 Tax=Paracoccidioides lutzii (strain ATCC MYA-826 / Pb01) TaxID=502779 RepID=C1GV02_PARBA|nr:hypothetical protein PAAG_02475 [Paracoccidioides lutzii Pb01]EEH40420.1 hypothetical protein PAAG_02475 [Paracoccidioides lutzii Pb01]